MIKLKDLKSVYFLGIGGIGMSAIARYFKSLGINVYGYDKTRNDFTRELENEGFIIHYDEDPEAIPSDVLNGKHSMVVYTPAIPRDHKELRLFISRRTPMFKRAEVLGMISESAFTIAVAGTHGKTTTSSMIAHILNECGVNFTAFLGGISSNFKNNYYRKENGTDIKELPVMVVEADEFDRSFLHLSPDIAIVTSTDADHLDIYGEHEEVKRSFNEFLNKLHEDGTAIIQDKLEMPSNRRTIRYGEKEDSDARYSDIFIKNHRFTFRYRFAETDMTVNNALPGFHNVENATAAITACMCLGLPENVIAAACADFKGVKRRFEYVVDTPEHTVIDDYAHHPAELKACISSVRELYPDKKLTGVFQPHLYSRTRDFADDFASVLDMLDECWLLDIYPAREQPIEGINAEFLALRMQKNPVLIAKENVIKHLETDKPELLLIMGAGDIDQLIKPIRLLYEKTD